MSWLSKYSFRTNSLPPRSNHVAPLKPLLEILESPLFVSGCHLHTRARFLFLKCIYSFWTQSHLPFFLVDSDSRNKSELIFLNASSVVFIIIEKKTGYCQIDSDSIGYFQKLDNSEERPSSVYFLCPKHHYNNPYYSSHPEGQLSRNKPGEGPLDKSTFLGFLKEGEWLAPCR